MRCELNYEITFTHDEMLRILRKYVDVSPDSVLRDPDTTDVKKEFIFYVNTYTDDEDNGDIV